MKAVHVRNDTLSQMSMKSVFLLFVLIAHQAVAQVDNNWCFGDSAGLSFNTGNPLPISTVICSYEASASISDSTGNLLFYAGAKSDDANTIFLTVWNNENEIMENGDSIYGHGSMTQGALIIPFPDNGNKYYLITIDIEPDHPGASFYSIIDMSFNSGLGKVITKNVPMGSDYYIGEKVVAVKHANGRDWWILFHQADVYDYLNTNNRFVKYLITPAGISPPVYQSIGSVTRGTAGAVGEMVINESGDKIALVGGTFSNNFQDQCVLFDLFDFDRCTGELSNYMLLGDTVLTHEGYYGCAFSRSGSKFYVTARKTNGNSTMSRIWQYDMNANDIRASKLELLYSPAGINWYGQMQLGPDGRIYISTAYGWTYPNTLYDSTNMNLSVINYPDSNWSACDLSLFSVPLGGRRAFGGLPNLPNYYLEKIPGSPCDTIVIQAPVQPPGEIIFSFYPNPSQGIANLTYSLNADQRGDIAIYDSRGRIVLKKELPADQTQMQLDLSHFAAGNYTWQIQINGQDFKSEKFVILR